MLNQEHERLNPVEALHRAFAAPPIEQLLPSLVRRDISKRIANFVRIENAGCVTVRIEKNKRVRLIEIDILGQPIKCAGVIVLDVNGQSLRPCSCGRGGDQQRLDPQRCRRKVDRQLKATLASEP